MASKAQWEHDKKGWWYKRADGTYPKNKWEKISGKWYFFNKSGYMMTGWTKVGSKWYYLNKSGVMQTGWLKDAAAWYYLLPTGETFTNGVKKIDKAWYAFDKNGVMTAELSKTEGRKATNMKIERDGYKYKGSWKLPTEATSSSSNYLYAKEQVVWEILNSGKPITATINQAIATTERTANVNSFNASNPKQTFKRADFYPLTKRVLNGLKLSVVGYGKYVKTATQSIAYNFTLPRKPTISWEYDTANGKVIATIKTDAGTDNAERYDTMYRAEVKTKDGKVVSLTPWTSSTSTEIKLSYDTASYISSLAVGQRITFTAYAYARGYKGDNPAKAKAVSRSRNIAIPSAASIKSVAATSKDATGRIAVNIQVGANTDNVKLQRRHGESGSWSDVEGATDNYDCKTLYDSVGLAELVDGEYLYYRIISTRDNFTTTGASFRADKLYTAVPTPASSKGAIVSLAVDPNGTGAKLVYGYTEEKVGTGTEVSWSTDPNAWESNEEPETYTFSWNDSKSQASKWNKTATLYIRNLEPGQTYYFKARRVYEGGFSEYAARTSITPAPAQDIAANVSLSAPDVVVRGNPIPCTWEYQGDLEQKSYAIHPQGNAKKSLVSGRGAISSANITPARYEKADTISFYVSVSTGTDMTDSNVVTVRIIDPPTCSVECNATCKAQPFSFTAYTDTVGARLGYKVVSKGILEDRPDGVRRQLNGDVVMTDMITPTWTTSGSRLKTTVSIPVSELIDSGLYRIEAFTVNVHDISSSVVSCDFAVAWTHQAPTPSSDITLDVDEENRSVKITLVSPTGAVNGDVYDLYRGTAAGFDLIKSSLQLNDVITDRFAAFGDQQFYRVCCRTTDGDIAWSNYVYSLPIDAMQFDWSDGSSESVHNLQLNDSYSKSFEKRDHIGQKKGSGYWNDTVTRTGSYSATAIKGREATNLEALGRHGGSAFCRTPEGYAFQCNVDVSRNTANSSILEDFSLNLTEVELTADFMPTDDDIEGAV